jgi:hypothetical protein
MMFASAFGAGNRPAKKAEDYIAIETSDGRVTVYHVHSDYNRSNCVGAWIMSDQADLMDALDRALVDEDDETNGWSGKSDAAKSWFNAVLARDWVNGIVAGAGNNTANYNIIAIASIAYNHYKVAIGGVTRLYPDACGPTGRKMLRLNNNITNNYR